MVTNLFGNSHFSHPNRPKLITNTLKSELKNVLRNDARYFNAPAFQTQSRSRTSGSGTHPTLNNSCQRRSARRRGFLRQRSPSNPAHTSKSHSARLRTNKRCGAVRNCTMIASHRVSLRSGNRFNEKTVSERILDAFPPCH